MKNILWTIAVLASGAALQFGISHLEMPVAHAQAAITDAEAIRWANDVIRPLAERRRGLNVAEEQALAEWFGGMNTKFPNDAGALEDGREAEGVSRLTGIDVNSFMGVVVTDVATMDAAGVANAINKPTVRRLEVQ